MAKLSGEQIKQKIKSLLNEANNTLKATGCSMRIEAKGDSLCIRGVLPSRNPDRCEPYRQRLALGLKMTPAAIAKAQEVARKISFELESERFDWDNYIDDPRETLTCGEWIEKFKDEFGVNLKHSSWEGSYNSYFKRLPEDQVMSAEILIRAYSQIDPKSKRARQLCRQAYIRLAELAKIEINLSKATRSKSDISKRNIPADNEIVQALTQIKKEEWHYAIAILATYGLRPHELSFLDFSEMPVLKVTDGKTGARRVYPIPSEWVDLFGLMKSRSLPKVKDFGRQASRYLASNKIDFVAYDLRHAYALRGTVQNKISLPVMARMMGHAPQIHLETYNAWIKDAHVDAEMAKL